jgi:hypothetical protein
MAAGTLAHVINVRGVRIMNPTSGLTPLVARR